MKKITFLFAFLLMVTVTIANQGMGENTVITLTEEPKREIIKGDRPGGATRDIGQQQSYAYLYNNKISLDIAECLSEVTVTIYNKTTEEMLYSEQFCHPATAVIDISLLATGQYKLEIITDENILIGEFTL
ncbi:MAG: DUF3244 domain-containing protein [Mediterranea massiliensis]|nr:DUF3244 domain-containing protein [Mediterranea massiliensis]